VWALYHDPDLMDVSGRTLIGAELAVMYGIKDEGNRQPPPTVSFSVCIRTSSTRTS
jgi:hypothetical protein